MTKALARRTFALPALTLSALLNGCVAAPQMTSPPATQSEVVPPTAEDVRNFGALAQAVGGVWAGDYYKQFWWDGPDHRSLSMLWYHADTYQWGLSMRFTLEPDGRLSTGTGGDWRVLPDGSVYTEWHINQAFCFLPDGRLVLSRGDAQGGRFNCQANDRHDGPMVRLTGAKADAVLADIARGPREAPKAAGSDSGWGSAIAGAIGGMAAVAAGGGNASQMISGASQGAALFSDKAGVQAAAQATAPMLNPGGAGAAHATAATSAARTPSASLASAAPSVGLKPDLTPSICNQPLSGDDVQFGTMCAQAESLYSQYANAVAQGYSAADCDRTYDAHRKAASVAANWARDAKAR